MAIRTAAPAGAPASAYTAAATGPLARQDPEIAEVIAGETARQTGSLQLIAAENFASPAVLAALGSPLVNKYAEGYPGARHHGGCEIVDAAERIAVERAAALFGAEHVNVQPHSGSAAVIAAYAALLRPGDTVLAMGLPFGGHLTHGSPANFSGRWFDFVGYGVDRDTGLIDYREVRRLAGTRGPKAIVCGSVTYPRHPDYALFREIADEVGAYLIVDAGHQTGLIAGGAAPSPVPYADVVCATTHKVLRGPRGGLLLCGGELAGRIDRAVFPFTQGGAQMNTVAAKAVALGGWAAPAGAREAPPGGAHTPGVARGVWGGGGRRRPRAPRAPRPRGAPPRRAAPPRSGGGGLRGPDGRYGHPSHRGGPCTPGGGREDRTRPSGGLRAGPRHLPAPVRRRARDPAGNGRGHHPGNG
ncbi:serine hydroxymethyltransferase [Streptomyces sp. NPDC058953]|uniref:serine hydroxymethyltransferase n=1 Tax=Streptomyces sp. NPDC058953 TaxID=3346676 RepID=UPI00367C5AC9